MCNFRYTECKPCSCQYYHGDFEHCRYFIKTCSPAKAKIEQTLVVQKTDDHGELDDWYDNTHFKTYTKEGAFQFETMNYCANPTFKPIKEPKNMKCPYHKPGGLKDTWDAEVKTSYNGAAELTENRDRERAAMKRIKKAEESKRLQESRAEGQKKADKEIAKQEKKAGKREEKYAKMKKKEREEVVKAHEKYVKMKKEELEGGVGNSCCIVQ